MFGLFKYLCFSLNAKPLLCFKLRPATLLHIAYGSCQFSCEQPKASYTISVKLNDFTVWRHIWRKNWVNCAVLTGNSAVLRSVLSSRLSHTELRSSLRESHSFFSLRADTTMASS
jgi:hypothetical protein